MRFNTSYDSKGDREQSNAKKKFRIWRCDIPRAKKEVISTVDGVVSKSYRSTL